MQSVILVIWIILNVTAYVQQWDGTKWSRVSDWISPMTERLRPLLQAAATDYVSGDTAWPKRTEPCAKLS